MTVGNTATLAILVSAWFGVALALHARIPGEQLFRIVFLMPMLMAPVAKEIWRMMFHSTLGPVNEFFTLFGLQHLPFLTNSTFMMASLITVEIWQWTPFVLLLMLAGLSSLPTDVYEAADLEDATPWQKFWGITFPCFCRSPRRSSSFAWSRASRSSTRSSC